MPLRILTILIGLFAVCLAITLLAWANGSDFYIFFLSKRITTIHKPPTDPVVILGLLVLGGIIYPFSQKSALLFFTLLISGLLLGSLVGYGVYAWSTTFSQSMLILAMIALTGYGWAKQKIYFDE